MNFSVQKSKISFLIKKMAKVADICQKIRGNIKKL